LLEKTPYQLSKWSVATEVPCFVMSHMMRWWIMQSERNLDLAQLFKLEVNSTI
jgi:hypothetical protein